ncbi:unnamed protein product [Rangifer tarandus platyrhynchus]|uniref:Uncharacterized protein n=1 Tax=Rangifer tarandus platyrhynchus TaxID=3082113 RepID=A0ABN8YL84_RANTA|nr:unnamed protein product [Rangifer tarandus platyrhynchus]
MRGTHLGAANLAGAGLVGARLGAGPGCPSRGVAHPGGGNHVMGGASPQGRGCLQGRGRAPKRDSSRSFQLPPDRVPQPRRRPPGGARQPGHRSPRVLSRSGLPPLTTPCPVTCCSPGAPFAHQGGPTWQDVLNLREQPETTEMFLRPKGFSPEAR